jgi:hypothetical protein
MAIIVTTERMGHSSGSARTLPTAPTNGGRIQRDSRTARRRALLGSIRPIGHLGCTSAGLPFRAGESPPLVDPGSLSQLPAGRRSANDRTTVLSDPSAEAPEYRSPQHSSGLASAP